MTKQQTSKFNALFAALNNAVVSAISQASTVYTRIHRAGYRAQSKGKVAYGENFEEVVRLLHLTGDCVDFLTTFSEGLNMNDEGMELVGSANWYNTHAYNLPTVFELLIEATSELLELTGLAFDALTIEDARDQAIVAGEEIFSLGCEVYPNAHWCSVTDDWREYTPC